MIKTFSMDLAGRKLSAEIGRVAELANGSAFITYGETVLIVTATASKKPRQGIDFFPLSIDYEEKMYSVGKIPGGFMKREARPSERAVLTSRLIDRPIRPLFPNDYRNDVTIIATVLSVDNDCSPEVVAMIGASLVLAISDIPFLEPVGSVNIGLVDNKFVVNPNSNDREKSDMVLTVSSTSEKVMMIEAGGNEIDDDIMYEGIMLAHEENKKIVEFINSIVSEVGKPKHSYEEYTIPKDIYSKVTNLITNERMEKAVFTDSKQERDAQVTDLKDEVKKEMLSTFDGEEVDSFIKTIDEAIYKFEKETVRRMILKEHKRPDGRKLDEIRKLSAEVDILPRTHGSGMFKRGQTQVLTVATLGSISEAQRIDGIDEFDNSKRYMHHYNFPSYSVGETRPSRGPGRREIGHGALAEKALLPVLPSESDFPYAIRLVSEILSSNGSTSQASVCGSTLALMSAGVPITRPVAGISVGLVTGEEDNDFVLLDDIQGLEDFFGDMDFKVAGTHVGITAIQLDMKINGITPEMIKQSLQQTKKSRIYILDEVMLKAISKPKNDLSVYAPRIAFMQIEPDKMSEVIGARGKVIKKIMEDSGATKIDTDEEGKIFISATTTEILEKAVSIIKSIVTDLTPGTIYNGKVTRLMAFGVFVEIAPGKEGLCHISQLASERVKAVEDVVSIGDEILVKLTEIDDQGRLNLSRKEALIQNK
jgi:polyribonucleotide nucleotidyltransferase